MLEPVQERGERRVVGDVEGDAEGITAELGRRLSCEVAVKVADGNDGALIRQGTRRREADTSRCPGYRHNLAGQRAWLSLPVLKHVTTSRVAAGTRRRWSGSPHRNARLVI